MTLSLAQHGRTYLIVSWKPAERDGGCALDKYVISLASSPEGPWMGASLPADGTLLRYIFTYLKKYF